MLSGVKIQNSPMFHVKFDGCQGVLIDKLSISSPKLSPNTDGIHLGNTKGVGIYNSMISNGTYQRTKNNVSFLNIEALFCLYTCQKSCLE